MAGRELRIDALRGGALLLIYWDHGLALARVTWLPLVATPINLAFCDATEAFVFLSGVVLGRVYAPLVARSVGLGWLRALGRAGEVWLAQMALFALTVAVCSVVGRSGAEWPMELGMYVEHPLEGMLDVPLLRIDAIGLDVLQVYIPLLVTGPLWLALYRHAPRVALGVAGLVWLLAPFVGTAAAPSMPSMPSISPLAWQLLFFVGAALGSARSATLPVLGPRILATADVAAALIVFGATFAKTLWLVLGHPPDAADPMDWSALIAASNSELFPGGGKKYLEPLRVLQFAGVVWLVLRRLPVDHPAWGTRAAGVFALLGRHSLPIYCATVVLDYLLGLPMQAYSRQPLVVAATFVLGAFALVGGARLLDAIDGARRAPAVVR